MLVKKHSGYIQANDGYKALPPSPSYAILGCVPQVAVFYCFLLTDNHSIVLVKWRMN
jgi:hypothetical protein